MRTVSGARTATGEARAGRGLPGTYRERSEAERRATPRPRRPATISGSPINGRQLRPQTRLAGPPCRRRTEFRAYRQQQTVRVRGRTPADPGRVDEVVGPRQRVARPQHTLGGYVIAPGLAERAVVDAEHGACPHAVQAGRGGGGAADPGQLASRLRGD